TRPARPRLLRRIHRQSQCDHRRARHPTRSPQHRRRPNARRRSRLALRPRWYCPGLRLVRPNTRLLHRPARRRNHPGTDHRSSHRHGPRCPATLPRPTETCGAPMTTQTTQHQLTRDTIEIPYRHVTTHFIDGAWRESQGQDTIEVTDPATNTVWGSVPVGTEEDVNAAVEAAHAAFTTGQWSKTTPTERAEIMLRIADEIEKRATELSL